MVTPFVRTSPVLSTITPVALSIPSLSYIFPDRLLKRLLGIFPQAEVRRMIAISDTMERRSMEIISEKKRALLKGDDALVHQIGEGKDIMSLLREFLAPPRRRDVSGRRLLIETYAYSEG